MRSSAVAAEAAEEEEFYESLDRILSSSCSSTSASDDDADRLRRRRGPPFATSSYDVWISDLSSVEERRRRLFQQLGLSGHLSLARTHPPADASGPTETVVEVNPPRHAHDGIPKPSSPTGVVIFRSRSDGSPGPNRAEMEPPKRRAISFGSATAAKAKRSWLLEGGKHKKFGGGDQQLCTIRNLDDGTEFVVKEVTEGGMWNKLKEIRTGQQFTMEEFEVWVGQSPIVQELMRRQTVEDRGSGGGNDEDCDSGLVNGGSKSGTGNSDGAKSKKKGGWLKTVKNMASTVFGGVRHHQRERRSSDEKDTSPEKVGRRSSSATDDSLDAPPSLHHVPERIKVRQYGKACKELTGLYINQEVKAHNGAIWSIKFSLDARYLASGGEDCVVHVWEVAELNRNEELAEEKMGENDNCYPFVPLIGNRSLEPAETVNCGDGSHRVSKRRLRALSRGKSMSSEHLMMPEHVFALSEKPTCTFTGHTADVLDVSWSKSQYLISSSMDKTVRLWHVSDSSCLKIFTHTDYENKLHIKSQIYLQAKKRRSRQKKITGFEFVPGSSSEVLITSADSRIRAVNGVDLIHKFKGFRNTSSQISASMTANGKYVICASEDSHVYMWRYDAHSQPNKRKSVVDSTESYERFHCQNVTVAIALPTPSRASSGSSVGHSNPQIYESLFHQVARTNSSSSHDLDTWPEENSPNNGPIPGNNSSELCHGTFLQPQSRSAWGMVIVTAGRRGEIKIYQNYGLPQCVSRHLIY
ncbi:WD repeat-containing protein 44-like isoform X2 [Zingiber officinale]|uniref:WD repeat-containing protein 44-like isoform X2 n=1 Tax=Zingiber officinale TaxID=94328 RepID=UPI001C4C9FC9|nr:WD repeat-containing protein 44-like isoform X2 [Zingiber officinale]